MTRCCPSREGPIAFWGSSGVCVGCCLSEDANLAAAPLVQSLFFRPRGRWPPKGRRRHVMVVGALVPTDAARVATSGATVYTSAPKRRREAILANLCTLLCSHGRPCDPRVATVYTNDPKRRRGAIFANLCTLLCSLGRPCDPRVATVYTNDPKWRRGAVLADLCTLLRHRPGSEATTPWR